ncbi:MAG: hypothetical protein ACYTE5_12620 [Planctomycetota bacterium]|jgi:hypothetical protein
MNLIVIEMFNIPIFTDPIDEFLFEELLDPVLPGQGLPIPLPVRVGLYAVQLQYEAGEAIAAGKVAGKSQYTGQAAQLERAKSLGMNLIYQPGGIQV